VFKIACFEESVCLRHRCFTYLGLEKEQPLSLALGKKNKETLERRVFLAIYIIEGPHMQTLWFSRESQRFKK